MQLYYLCSANIFCKYNCVDRDQTACLYASMLVSYAMSGSLATCQLLIQSDLRQSRHHIITYHGLVDLKIHTLRITHWLSDSGTAHVT